MEDGAGSLLSARPRTRARGLRVDVLIGIASLAAVYFVAAKLGLTLAFVHTSATAVWPPTGIAIAALVLFGRRLWPGVLLGAFLVNLTTPSGAPLTSMGIASGNTLEGLAAAYLTARYCRGPQAFERPQDVFKFAILAALLSTTVSATIGVSSLVVTGFAAQADVAAIWMTWWLGDAGGALIVTPALVLWGRVLLRHDRLARWDRRRASEGAALLVGLVATGLVVFWGVHPFPEKTHPVGFLTFPVLVWAAFRFGPREAATAIAALAALAVFGTLQGLGPFAVEQQNESLILLQAFMGVASVTTLGLAAAVLERQRAEQTIVETQERLRLAEERKVAARDEFLSVAAHELKTPLAGLQVAVQFLLRQLDRGVPIGPEQLPQALRTIGERSAKLGLLVNDLLDTVQIETGRLDAHVRPHDLAAIVGGAVDQARATTTTHDISLTAPATLPAVLDALRIEQVVVNLLDNAVKFSPGGGRIDVELTGLDERTARLVVRDHGIGIPVEHRPHVFERFYQAHPETQRSGLGLGLHVTRSIVELHGGNISAEFPDDGGTRFVVVLPTHATAPAPALAGAGR